jgi:hypothetical protein
MGGVLGASLWIDRIVARQILANQRIDAMLRG